MPGTSRGTGRLMYRGVSTAVRPTLDELAEFERLEATAPLDKEGCPA